MAFSDPQSITPTGGSAISLPRTAAGENRSVYTSADGLNVFQISSQYGKRNRRTLRITQNKITADPFIPANNVRINGTVYIVTDFPVAGFTVAEQAALAGGLCTYASASTNANLVKLLGGEN
jgi:hypothetical protein